MNKRDPNLTPSGLRGFFQPVGPTGRGSILQAPPWYLTARIMRIEYEIDEAAARSILLPPLELSDTEPTTAMVWFGDWTIVPADDTDLLYRHPDRCFYNETQMVIRCKFKGQEGISSRWLWVDTETGLYPGQFMGFPQKLGNTYLTFNRSVTDKLNEAVGARPFGTGSRLAAKTVAHGETLMRGGMTLDHLATSEDGISFPPFFLLLHWPSLDENSSLPMVHQITTINDKVTVGDVWVGKDAYLEFYDSDLEEYMPFAPKKVLRSSYMEVGFIHTGITVLYDYLKNE